ncbi:MAG: hypothetical protein QM680_05975 [Luteolibacter sp.]
MKEEFHEPLRKKVGGSLARRSPLERLEMLKKNALMLRGGKWTPPQNDGTLVRKVVGHPRSR